tara:strand:- start:493 stop:1206 length:714 start_codon:yes stop_codon:yes gene_type:complete
MNLKHFKTYVPNLFTLLNLFCGSVGVVFAVQVDLITSSYFVLLGILFDFFDGFFARKFNSQSSLGLQLDSLADMVTSGLIPGIFMMNLLQLSLDSSWPMWDIIPYFALIITLCSAYRLANFNISKHNNFFIGLPTPANTLLIVSLPLVLEFQDSKLWSSIILSPIFLVVLTFLLSFLLNSKLRLISLKFKTWDIRNNLDKYILIISSFLILIFFKWAGIFLMIIYYILFSVLRSPKS